MTPRPDIVAIRADATLGDLRARLRESEYSRLLVYRESLDDVVGFVHMKDVFLKGAGHADASRSPRWCGRRTSCPRPSARRSCSRNCSARASQTALVVDEYGGTAGLVTVEDLVEELVGEIRDEYDVEAEPDRRGAGRHLGVQRQGRHRRTHASGSASTIEREGFETVGGYLHEPPRAACPAVGEHVVEDGLDIEVLEAERRRVPRCGSGGCRRRGEE